MYVYAQGLTKGVNGFIEDGAEEGEYIMTVSANERAAGKCGIPSLLHNFSTQYFWFLDLQ